MSQYDSVMYDASQLPVSERLRLIDELSATVPDDQPPTLSKEWITEIERRSAEVDTSVVETIPWDEVRKNLFRKTSVDGEN